MKQEDWNKFWLNLKGEFCNFFSQKKKKKISSPCKNKLEGDTLKKQKTKKEDGE